ALLPAFEREAVLPGIKRAIRQEDPLAAAVCSYRPDRLALIQDSDLGVRLRTTGDDRIAAGIDAHHIETGRDRRLAGLAGRRRVRRRGSASPGACGLGRLSRAVTGALGSVGGRTGIASRRGRSGRAGRRRSIAGIVLVLLIDREE